MKHLILIIGLLLGSNTALVGQSKLDQLSKSIEKGDAKTLSLYFGENVDLSIPEAEGVYSQTQAVMIVKKFFEQYTPTSYSINHEGKSKSETKFTIGTLVTEKSTFRTYILLKKQIEQMQILELRIEPEE